MSNARGSTAVAVMLGAAFAYLYLSFLRWYALNPVYHPQGGLEMLILETQVLRLALVMLFRRMRGADTILVLLLLSLEVLAIPVLVLISLVTGDQSYLSTLKSFIVAWPAGLLLVFPVFDINRVAANARRGARLSSVIPSATASFIVLSFLVSASARAPGGVQSGPGGLAGLSTILVAAFLNGATPVSAVAPEVEAAGIVLFVGLVYYAASQGGSNRPQGVVVFPLAICVGGTVFAIAWSAALARYFSSSALFALGIPGIVLLTAVWWIGRARR